MTSRPGWTKGYSQAELDQAQEKYRLVFPPDLVALLREKRPLDGHDWTDEVKTRRMLDWPFDGLVLSVERGFLWWPEWGEKPADAEARNEVLRAVVSRAPKLIPLIAHRFLPEQPHESGNPVFSVFHSDIIYYGANLEDYFEREFAGWNQRPWPKHVKTIPFWSELVDRFAVGRNRTT
jgi:hypothetical protein